MKTRRTFLRASAGIAFCRCCMLDTACAQQAPPARMPVMGAGKRVKTVDAHCHCYFEDALDLMGGDTQAILPATKGVQAHFLQIDGAAQVGASQIVLGTEFPIPWEEHPVDHVFATATLTDDEKIAMLGGNAARLFGLAA